MQGSGFGDQGSGFRVQGSGFRVEGAGSRVQGRGLRFENLEHVLDEGLALFRHEFGTLRRGSGLGFRE